MAESCPLEIWIGGVVMRVSFDSILNPKDGWLIPRAHVLIGHVAVAAGTLLSPTLMILGAEVGGLADCDLEIRIEDGLVRIGGLYPSDNRALLSPQRHSH